MTTSIIVCTELQFNFRLGEYSIEEGAPVPDIIFDFRETRIPFTVNLYPVSITEAHDTEGFNTEIFIPTANISEATPGEGVVESAVVVENQCQVSYYLVKAITVHTNIELPSQKSGVIDLFSSVGADFTNETRNITIPAGVTSHPIPRSQMFDIVDDRIHEVEQIFALVAQLGVDVEGIECFQLADGSGGCFGRTGATKIRIRDNDGRFFSKYFLNVDNF